MRRMGFLVVVDHSEEGTSHFLQWWDSATLWSLTNDHLSRRNVTAGEASE